MRRQRAMSGFEGARQDVLRRKQVHLLGYRNLCIDFHWIGLVALPASAFFSMYSEMILSDIAGQDYLCPSIKVVKALCAMGSWGLVVVLWTALCRRLPLSFKLQKQLTATFLPFVLCPAAVASLYSFEAQVPENVSDLRIPECWQGAFEKSNDVVQICIFYHFRILVSNLVHGFSASAAASSRGPQRGCIRDSKEFSPNWLSTRLPSRYLLPFWGLRQLFRSCSSAFDNVVSLMAMITLEGGGFRGMYFAHRFVPYGLEYNGLIFLVVVLACTSLFVWDIFQNGEDNSDDLHEFRIALLVCCPAFLFYLFWITGSKLRLSDKFAVTS